ncbi:MAG TPA: type IV pilus secretin PilQ [Mariprofundaceae bacterium]|nr:type IV pilus secretin PilQ [Mariprofundaceae bacterium]
MKQYLQNLLKLALVVLPGLALAPNGASALEVQKLSATAGQAGEVLSISLDSKGAYQVFDLESPNRLVINFPKGKIKTGLEPLRSVGNGVGSVFPIQTPDGARVEIGLDENVQYKINEKGSVIEVLFTGGSQATASPDNAAVIEDVSVKDSGQVTELVLRGEHMDANHNAFMSSDGKSMILDFWGGQSKLEKEHYGYSTQKVSGVTVGAADGRVRLVVDLVPTANMAHQIEASADQMVIRFGKVEPTRHAEMNVVQSVTFEPEDRIGHVIVRTDSTNPIVDLKEKAGNVIIDIAKASLAPGQEQTQDVSAFPGPVKQIDSYAVDQKVRIVARLRDKVQVSSFQSGNILTINLEPEDMVQARKGEVAQAEKFAYVGKKVTFDFKDIDIKNALKLIAEMSDLNIIMSDDVKGTLTMRLVDVPWDQALDLILAARGLGKERMGNVLRVAPLSVLQAEHETKLKEQKVRNELDPLVTEFVTTNFANAKDIATIINTGSKNATTTQPAAGAAGANATEAENTPSGSSGLLTKRGSLLVDERTNTIIITDTEDAINNIKRLISAIDKPADQVLIEARIVEATDTFSRDLGIRWGGFYSKTSSKYATSVSNTPNAAPPGGYLVDLPAAVGAGAGGSIGFSLAAVNNAFNLNLELSAAEANGDIKVISNPRVITTNMTPAEISQGDDIPFQSSSANAGTSIQFKQAKLGLTVTPQITPEKGIILKVEVTKDTPRANDLQAGGAPIITTKKVQTSIYMDNGETVVIGGIYTRNQSTTVNGVPFLQDIPLLGYLFKQKLKSDNRTELLIFLTPKVIQAGKENLANES